MATKISIKYSAVLRDYINDRDLDHKVLSADMTKVEAVIPMTLKRAIMMALNHKDPGGTTLEDDTKRRSLFEKVLEEKDLEVEERAVILELARKSTLTPMVTTQLSNHLNGKA